MTIAIWASRRPWTIASTIAWRLDPRPEMRTPRRRERGRESFSPGILFASGRERSAIMPRRLRMGSAGVVFHVLNRAAKRLPLFENAYDYAAFEALLFEAKIKHPLC